MSKPTLWELLQSGELHRLAKQFDTMADLARHLGVKRGGFDSMRMRARRRGEHFPTWEELRGDAPVAASTPMERWPNVAAFDSDDASSGQASAAIPTDAFAEDEITQPNIPAWMVAEIKPAPRVEVVEETITRVEEHRLKKRVKDLESELRELTAQLSDGGEYHEVIADVLARQHEERTTIEPRERTSGLREATPLVLASDWHLEEEVRPEQVAGRNRYNLEIAAHRMERFFESVRWGISHQREVFKIRDFICWWGGDLITNFLHDDNIESNLLHPTEAILFAQDGIIKGIDHWLQDAEIEQFVFPCNDGNHGRLTKQLRAATRTQNSLEVFLYAQLANHYRNEPRVRFVLPTSPFTFLDGVYGKTIRFTHGDTFKYSGGIGGIMVPMLRAIANWESVKRADLTCMGNWHQRICLPTAMVNGSLIGYNTFAMMIGARFEPPVQSMRMLDARRWCSTDVPLWVAERADDEQNAEAA